MNTAAKVREAKEKNPENFCPNSKCLWRIVTREGFKPCPTHMPEHSGEEILMHAIRHIRRLHMDCRGWTLPVGDFHAIELMLKIREDELSNCIAEFDRINMTRNFAHPVSE